MNADEMRGVLNREAARNNLPDPWQPSGSAFGFTHRAVIGQAFVELDYDYPAILGDVPRWVATVWRSCIAYETDRCDDGKIAVVYCDVPPPSGMREEHREKLARFAAGCVRLAASLECVHYAEAVPVAT